MELRPFLIASWLRDQLGWLGHKAGAKRGRESGTSMRVPGMQRAKIAAHSRLSRYDDCVSRGCRLG